MSDFHKLKVNDIIKETESCVTVLFEIDEEYKQDFKFKAGQYLTIKALIDGEEVRRAYSISTGNYEDLIGVSVKKIKDGRMSNYLNHSIKKGDELEVMKPEGKFTLITHVDIQKDHYFFAAGSGITPVMSMLKSMLEDEPKSTAYLLYGSRDEKNIIFRKKLEELQSRYEGQLIIDHTLSNPIKDKSDGIMGLLGKSKTKWRGLKGRIDSSKVARFIQDNPPKSANVEYYVCGPGDMIDTVKTTLMGNGVSKKDINQEYFTAGDTGNSETVNAAAGATLVAQLDGKEIKLEIKDGKSILDTLLDAGHEAPYSCTSGACSTCMAKVTKGTVEMEACFALDDDEIKDGYVLTCQAHPTSNQVEIEFE